LPEGFRADLQRHIAEVVAVQMEEVEGDEIQVMLPAGDCLPKGDKV